MPWLKAHWYQIIIVLAALAAWVTWFSGKPQSRSRLPHDTAVVVDTSTSTPIVSTSGITVPYSATIVMKVNTDNENHTDIFLYTNGQEIYYVTLTEVYRTHYHSFEFHNGNLYFIRRTGGDSGYERYPDWTDELWRYDNNGHAKKIFFTRGLDFRVSEDENFIAVGTNDRFVILNNEGEELKFFTRNEIVIPSEHGDALQFNFLSWAPNTVWLDITFGPSLVGLVKINTASFSATTYNLLGQTYNGPDYALNVVREKLAISNYPAMFDVDSEQEFVRSSANVYLVVYDLNSESKTNVASSVVKKFEPKWINENELEYNDTDGEGRAVYKID